MKQVNITLGWASVFINSPIYFHVYFFLSFFLSFFPYIYTYIYMHIYDQVVLLARSFWFTIPQSLFLPLSIPVSLYVTLSSITSGNSSGQHQIITQSWCMKWKLHCNTYLCLYLSSSLSLSLSLSLSYFRSLYIYMCIYIYIYIYVCVCVCVCVCDLLRICFSPCPKSEFYCCKTYIYIYIYIYAQRFFKKLKTSPRRLRSVLEISTFLTSGLFCKQFFHLPDIR